MLAAKEICEGSFGFTKKKGKKKKGRKLLSSSQKALSWSQKRALTISSKKSASLVGRTCDLQNNNLKVVNKGSPEKLQSIEEDTKTV